MLHVFVGLDLFICFLLPYGHKSHHAFGYFAVLCVRRGLFWHDFCVFLAPSSMWSLHGISLLQAAKYGALPYLLNAAVFSLLPETRRRPDMTTCDRGSSDRGSERYAQPTVMRGALACALDSVTKYDECPMNTQSHQRVDKQDL